MHVAILNWLILSIPVSHSRNKDATTVVPKSRWFTIIIFLLGMLLTITNLRLSTDAAVVLTWDLVNASYCSSVDYVVNATEGCGSCSVSQERNTATCRDARRGISCTYFVFANVCGDHIRSETNIKLTSSGEYCKSIVIMQSLLSRIILAAVHNCYVPGLLVLPILCLHPSIYFTFM